MKYLAYVNILFGDNHVQTVEIGKLFLSPEKIVDMIFFKIPRYRILVHVLYCNIFWWKLIDRIFLNEIFNTRVVSQGIPLFQLPITKSF
jgi:prepilin-type processing-associated H-X9-DG protein